MCNNTTGEACAGESQNSDILQQGRHLHDWGSCKKPVFDLSIHVLGAHTPSLNAIHRSCLPYIVTNKITPAIRCSNRNDENASTKAHTIRWAPIAAKAWRTWRSTWRIADWWTLMQLSTETLRCAGFWWWRCKTWALAAAASHDLAEEVIRPVTDSWRCSWAVIWVASRGTWNRWSTACLEFLS